MCMSKTQLALAADYSFHPVCCRTFKLLPVLCALLWGGSVAAHEAQSPKTKPYNPKENLYTPGSGSVYLSYQNINVNEFHQGVRRVPIGEVETHSLYLEAQYAVAERWRVEVGVPFVKKRFSGPGVHDPLKLDPPRPEVPLIDDAKYHSKLQDFMFGVHYLWLDKTVQVEPFVRAFIPSNDYPFFGNAAVGQNLWKVEAGLDLTQSMPFSDWYYQASASYTIAEKTLGISINNVRFNAKLGYFLTPNLALNTFLIGHLGKGNSAQAFPPSTRNTEAWYQHDRTTRHNSVNAGIGTDWSFKENYQLSAHLFTTVWGDSVHWIDIAGGIGITRYF